MGNCGQAEKKNGMEVKIWQELENKAYKFSTYNITL